MQAAVLDGIGAKDIDGDFFLCLRGARLRFRVVLKRFEARGLKEVGEAEAET